ncbi:MAG: carbohydrate-binding protein [Polyangiales bacterium]
MYRPLAIIIISTTAACVANGSSEPDRSAQEIVVSCPSPTPAWSAGTSYAKGAIVSYAGSSYLCIQPHTALSTWTPDAVASLWERVTCSGSSAPPPSPGGCGDAGAPADTGAPDSGASSDSGSTPADTGSGTPPPPSPGGRELAPYFYSWGWGNPAYPFASLVELKTKSGLGAATIAFVLSDGTCKATRDIQDHAADVKAFTGSGGHLKASFGGADGTYLESACGDSATLAKAIGDFVGETGITDLDFDVEQPPSMTSDVNAKRAAALATVQKEKAIKVAFTLPCTPRDKWDTPGGLNSYALDVVSAAVKAGVVISHVNLMTMDYGGYYSTGYKMGDLAVSAATDTVTQLRKLMPSLSESAAWAMIGITPMIGQNDVSSEMFSLDDAKIVASFAKTKGVGLLAFWAINRDQPGSGSLGLYSQAQTKTFAFTDAFRAGL